MPPKTKVTKDSIIEAAFGIIQDKGIDGLNARELARVLNCSTQPIFHSFENMETLKLSLYHKVESYYNNYVESGAVHANPFLGIGLAYIKFAKEERNLFKFLFMSEHFEIKSFFDMVEGEDNQTVIGMISQMSGLSHQLAKELFVDIWLITHGIASMFATNSCNLKDSEIEQILKDTFSGFKHQLSERTSI